jgi:hypothetical protein
MLPDLDELLDDLNLEGGSDRGLGRAERREVDSQNKPNQHCNHHTRNGDPDNEANSLGHWSVIVVAMLVRFPRHTNSEVHHFHCPLHRHIGRAAAEDNFGVFLSGLPQLHVLEIESVVAVGETVSGDSEGRKRERRQLTCRLPRH